ncbi:TPA: hypothetical protein N0F65_009867 [Lagenidium giganteum]|uniref:Uncharacterized protein n=1 Tax=Lagenidium giganteum TaxID=4803 RepID=A0AAV2YP96_9STRA|nr:TPA: hypothetical protein N0F65_009867 [Lagenidium giganteum]
MGEEETPVLVYRAAKQFHSVDMYTLANALWHVKASRLKKAFPEILVAEVVCALSPYARIVRQIDRLHDRQAHESLWIEYIFDRGHFVAIGRRQLKSFRQYQSSTATLECHGVILRPLLTPLPDGCFQIGCSVQRIMSINPRNKDVPDMQRHFVDDLPRHILEWEEAFVHDAEPNLLNFFPTSPFATPSIG